MDIDKKDIQEIITLKLKESEKEFGKEFKIRLIEILGLEKMLNPIGQKEEKPRLIPLVEWNLYHPYPTTKGLRMKVFKNPNHFVEEVIERDGKRILINEENYFKWHKKYGSNNT